MSWEAIEKPKGKAKITHPVAVTLKQFRGGVRWMTVRIAQSVLAQAKLKAGDLVAVFRGRSEDMGRLRLVKAPAGFALTATGKRTTASPLFVRFPWPVELAEVKPTGVAFKATQLEGSPALEITLPAPFSAPQPVAKAGARNVTADLMGDPKR